MSDKIQLIGDHHTYHEAGTVLEVVDTAHEAVQAPLRVAREAAEVLVKNGDARYIVEEPIADETADDLDDDGKSKDYSRPQSHGEKGDE